MTAALSRSIRVRSYRDTVRDASRIFRLAADADLRAALKRVALAAVPQDAGWTTLVFTVERTAAGEHVAAVLDHLARREMSARDFAAAVAASLDGAIAVLAVASKDPARIERVWSALSSAAR